MSYPAAAKRQTSNPCEVCHCEPHCLVNRLSLAKTVMPTKSRTLHRGDTLYCQQDLAQGVFVIKSGSFKSSFSNPQGIEQISSFHFSGDLLGVDSLESGHHTNAVTALETASICQLPIEILASSHQASQNFFSIMMRIMANKITEREAHAFVIANCTTKQRLAWFLFKLSGLLRARRLDCSTFNLTMSRYDISNYLAMAVETVSRVFTEFESEGILKVERKLIKIIQPQALLEVGNVLPKSDLKIHIGQAVVS